MEGVEHLETAPCFSSNRKQPPKIQGNSNEIPTLKPRMGNCSREDLNGEIPCEKHVCISENGLSPLRLGPEFGSLSAARCGSCASSGSFD